MPTWSTRFAAAFALMLSTTVAAGGSVEQGDVFDRVTHGFATSDSGVKIHYASLGKGPVVVMIHGFPDFWYSWRHQMDALAQNFQVVAIDQRGYNQSDKPKGVESYDMRLLVGDVAAVIRHLGRDRATIVGHDWGGVVAWQFAMNLPQMTENLVILNLPHPQGLMRELRINAEQIKNSEYARTFQEKTPADPTVFFGRPMTAENLAGWVRDPAARKRYIEAFQRSDFDAMLNYYKRNYPRQFGADAPAPPPMPKVQVPVLMFHGLGDTALHSDGLSGTWNWVAKDLTLVTIPGAGHFVQQDAADLVTTTMKSWLSSRTSTAVASAQSANPLTANAKIQLGALTGFVIRSAEKVPADLYSFRATPEVRSMGQLFGHIADALFSMCSTAAGAKPPRTGIEKSVSDKPALIAALKEGVSYCNTVFDGMTDQKGTETVPFYFGPTPRLSVLYFAVTHTYEHYGNLVTYMRLKNIVPPSSEPAKPQ